MRSTKPPFLRTKRGCNRCKSFHDDKNSLLTCLGTLGRTFKKKCDEGQPFCARCIRAGTACTWPKSHELKDARVRKTTRIEQSVTSRSTSSTNYEYGIDKAVSMDTAPTATTWTSFSSMLLAPRLVTTITSSNDYMLFRYFITVFFTKQLLPKACSHFQSVTLHVGRIALHDPPMLQIASACAALHMYQTSKTPELHRMALSYYGQSMSHLAKGLLQRESLSEDGLDSIGFTMSFLYIFAVCRLTDDLTWTLPTKQNHVGLQR